MGIPGADCWGVCDSLKILNISLSCSKGTFPAIAAPRIRASSDMYSALSCDCSVKVASIRLYSGEFIASVAEMSGRKRGKSFSYTAYAPNRSKLGRSPCLGSMALVILYLFG